RPETLRLQPSAFIDDAQVDRALGALERVLVILAHDRGDRLIRYLCTGPDGAVPAAAPRGDAPHQGPAPGTASGGRGALRPRRTASVPPFAGRVSFLGHFIRAGHLRHWDPGLAELGDEALERYLDRTHRLLDPFLSEQAIVESVIGERVHLSFIGV